MPWDIYIEPALATTYFRRCQEFGLQQSTELVCRRRGMQLALSYNEPDYLTRNPTSQHGSGYTFTWCRPTVEPMWSRTIWDDLSETHIGCLSLVIVRRAGLLWSQQDFEWRWSVPLFKCLTVLEFSFILFDLCLLITFFNFIMNYVPIVTFWIFTYHKIWILSIMFCFIWSYWIIYFLACLEVSWRVVS